MTNKVRLLLGISVLMVGALISGCIGKGECWWYEGKNCWWFNEHKISHPTTATQLTPPSTNATQEKNVTQETEKEEKPEQKKEEKPEVELGC